MMSTYDRKFYHLFIIALVMFAVGCQTKPTAPVQAAETLEQKAFALLGTYDIYHGLAEGVVMDVNAPIEIRRGLQTADRLGTPLILSLNIAVVEYADAKREYELAIAQGADLPSERLSAALFQVSKRYDDAIPLVYNIVNLVNEVRDDE